jgi:hypothetical protein
MPRSTVDLESEGMTSLMRSIYIGWMRWATGWITCRTSCWSRKAVGSLTAGKGGDASFYPEIPLVARVAGG